MTLVVESCAPMLTVQDDGRTGRGHQGVARSGAFDQRARAAANRLVGNHRDAAVLEALLGSCALVATEAAVIAVTGARVPVVMNGRPAAQDMAVFLAEGDRLNIGMPTEGLRAYVSLRGGVGGPLVLGSRSYDSLGRIGPAPLAPGDEIICAHDTTETDPWFEPIPTRAMAAQPTLALMDGPRLAWLTDDACHQLTSAVWTVDGASDRIGVRLLGPRLTRWPHLVYAELPSEAMIPGAVQVPLNGQPIILGPDCGTTGGYPVVGVVTARSLGDVAQLRPGDHLRFGAGDRLSRPGPS